MSSGKRRRKEKENKKKDEDEEEKEKMMMILGIFSVMCNSNLMNSLECSKSE